MEAMSRVEALELLELPLHGASPADVRLAFHRMALQCHPDKAGPEAKATFQRICQARPHPRPHSYTHSPLGSEAMGAPLSHISSVQCGTHVSNEAVGHKPAIS